MCMTMPRWQDQMVDIILLFGSSGENPTYELLILVNPFDAEEEYTRL